MSDETHKFSGEAPREDGVHETEHDWRVDAINRARSERLHPQGATSTLASTEPVKQFASVLLDQLNHELVLTEEFIVALGFGERAEVPCADGLLVFGKKGDHWGLYWDGGNGELKPLTSASKKQRIEAVAVLPALVQALRDATKARADQVTDAIVALQRFRKDYAP